MLVLFDVHVHFIYLFIYYLIICLCIPLFSTYIYIYVMIHVYKSQTLAFWIRLGQRALFGPAIFTGESSVTYG